MKHDCARIASHSEATKGQDHCMCKTHKYGDKKRDSMSKCFKTSMFQHNWNFFKVYHISHLLSSHEKWIFFKHITHYLITTRDGSHMCHSSWIKQGTTRTHQAHGRGNQRHYNLRLYYLSRTQHMSGFFRYKSQGYLIPVRMNSTTNHNLSI